MTSNGCVQCGANTYSSDGASSCSNCPSGKESSAGSTSAADCTYSKSDYFLHSNNLMGNIF